MNFKFSYDLYRNNIKTMRYIIFITSILLVSHIYPAFAQIKPDKSLGLHSTVIVPGGMINAKKTSLILGGKKKGNLLIHSFDKFNIRTNEGIIYSPDNDIKIIVARVSNSRSYLNGALGINGNQDIVFINPKGITIGRDFQSGIQGSITFSTASNLKFGKSVISTVSKEIYLDNSSSVGQNFIYKISSQTDGDFRIENTPSDLAQINFVGFFPIPSQSGGRPNGLVLSPNQKISVYSRNIILDRGIISSLSGDIELIALKDGEVTQFFDRNPSKYSSLQLGEIRLNNQSNIVNLNNFGNTISLTADRIILERGSIISSFSNDPSQVSPSSITLNGNQINFISEKNPEMFGVPGPIRSGILSNAEFGRGVDININSNKFEILGSSGVLTRATNNATGGNIKLNISDHLKLLGGESILGSSGIGATAFQQATGGNIDIVAKKIALLNSASIQTNNFDIALPGKINVLAEDINIAGINPFIPIASQIQTNSFGSQLAGDIDVRAQTISVSDGGGIGSTTQIGTTGNVNIAARTIHLTGETPGTLGRTRLYSSVQEQEEFLQDLFNLSPEQRMPNGRASNLSVTAENISISNNAEISVKNDGSGDAGNLEVRTKSLNLFDDAEIVAATNGGDGGNIHLDTKLLSLNNSSIASSSTGAGLGGNIKVNSTLASLNQESRVEANAENNRAGNISWTTNTLLASPDSQVTATSNRGANFDGNIETNIQNTQLIKTIKLAPLRPVNTEVSQICGFDGNRLSATSEADFKTITENPSLITAWDIQQRYLTHKGKYFRDIKTGEIKPIRPVLALEYMDNGEIRSIYEPDESEYVINLISSLERKCSELRST